MDNPILKTDSYKFSHWKQYPEGTGGISFYFNARNASKNKPVVFFGLQPILIQLQEETITKDNVHEAATICRSHFGTEDIFNYEGFQHIVEDHAGKWPVYIFALPEGTVVTDDRALFVVENTCPKCYWVPSFLETRLDQVWAPTTVASNSFTTRAMIQRYMDRTGSVGDVEFKLHDFGVRGASSMETAALCGMGHLLSFKGTDNVPALAAARKYYNADMAGYSVAASEHSVATAYGSGSGEYSYINRMIHVNAGSTFSVVLDSYNIYEAVEKALGFRDKIIQTKSTMVLRPDSGEPELVIPAVLKMCELHLEGEITINDKGFKTLPSWLRVIQGDGMTPYTIGLLLERLERDGWAADNIVFGMGSGMLQEIRRDDYGFTMKASEITVHGFSYPIYKDPVTSKSKVSKKGRQVSSEMLLIFRDGNRFNQRLWESVLKRVREGRQLLDQKI